MHPNSAEVDSSDNCIPPHSPQADRSSDSKARTVSMGRATLIARLFIAPLLLALLWTFALPTQAWADTIYVERGDAVNGQQTTLYTWNDVTNVETPIGLNTYVGGSFNGQNVMVDGIALHPTTGALYGFVVDDTANATLVPVDIGALTVANARSQLVTVNTTTAVVTPVNSTNWNDGFAFLGGAFDPSGRLWAVDIVGDQLAEIDIATGLVIAGSAVSVGTNLGLGTDLAFTANGVGVIVANDFEFYVFDPVAEEVIPISAVAATPVGFDGDLNPPYAVAGAAFTTHLDARGADTSEAEICRLNIYEGRQQDQYGHADDPFTTIPIVAYAELDAADPNTGPGDMASDVFPNCVFDFGDLPSSYDTGTPASHGLSPNLKLGTLVDAENGPAPSIYAEGDDTNNDDDEDGVTFLNELMPNQTAQVDVVSTGTGLLNAWADFNEDGDFDDADEQIFSDQPLTAGTNNLSFGVPPTATANLYYLRFRLSTQGGLSPTGAAPDGEVEDYRLPALPPPFPPCDARAFHSLSLSGGAFSDWTSINLVTGEQTLLNEDLGTANDIFVNAIGYNVLDDRVYGTETVPGAPNTNSGYLIVIGSDNVGQRIGPVPGLPASPVFVTGDVGPNGLYYATNGAGLGGFEGVWVIDVNPASPTYLTIVDTFTRVDTGNDDGGTEAGADWAYRPSDNRLYGVRANKELVYTDPTTGEVTLVGTLALDGGNTNNGAIFFDADGFAYVYKSDTGTIFRVNVDTATATPFASGPTIGGGNDAARCPNAPILIDFGDAPDSYGTTLANDGARHDNSNGSTVYLGSTVDTEDDGQPNTDANGDDTTDSDDEDGVAFNPALGYITPTLRSGLDPLSLQPVTNTLQVTASVPGFVSVWVDWNGDGDFNDAGEQEITAQAVVIGANSLVFAQDINPPTISTYVRVRYSTDAAAIASPTGPAIDGEVEDYRVQVERLVQPDACTTSGQAYYAFTFAAPVNTTGTGGVGSTATYQNITVVNGVAVDMFVEVIAGTLNPGQVLVQPNGIGIGDGVIFGTDDARWQINTDATLRYTFYAAGTTTPMAVNAVFTVSDMDGTEFATFAAADLAAYAITQGSAVTIIESGGNVRFAGNGGWNGDPQSRFQIVLEGISTLDARWQGSSNSGFGFDGDGDLSIQPPACEDWGDAPNTYGTTAASNGPNHTIVAGVYLGSQIDFDPDGQPTTNADGDDTSRLDDEDAYSGVPHLILANSPAPNGSTITTTMACAPDGASVVGYIDLNGDGIFGTGHEKSATATCTGGVANLTWTLANATTTAKNTYMRLRIALNSAEIQTPTGPASSGEVEDYRIILDAPAQTTFAVCDARAFLFQGDINSNGYAVNLVTGAAPLVFANMANETNAIGYNQIDNFIWGYCYDGCPTTGSGPTNYLTRVGAGGGNTDFGPITGLPSGGNHIGDVRPDGLMFLTSGDHMYMVDLRPTSLTYLTVVSDTLFSGFDSSANAGINMAGADWAFHPGNGQLYSVYPVVNGAATNGGLLRINPETGEITNLGLLRNNANTANVNFGASTVGWGAVYFDSAGYFYISENGTGRIHRVDITDPATATNNYRTVLFANGPLSGLNDGARCNNAPLPLDLGDAPDTYGTTFDASGARHDRSTNTGLFLGAAVDTENDGQPSVNADGDDNNGTTPDDEDGVTLNTTFAPGQSVQIPVQVNGTGGRLHAWIDWNQDGDFADAGEQIATNLAAPAGTVNVNVNVPATAVLGTTYARFRLTTQTTLGPTGPAPDGEVEDYLVSIGVPVLSSTKRDVLLVDADSSGTASPGDTLRYTVIITNSGTGTAINATYTDALDPNTTLDDGSVTTTQGSVTTGNGGGDSSVAVALGNLQPNTDVTIVYDALINNPLPAGVIQVSNQGIVGVDNPNIPDEPTDDPDDPDPDDPTDTPISASPKLEAFKRDTLLVDADTSGAPSPGDTLLYTVTIVNSGNQAASNMVYVDTPDPNTTLVVGSVTTSQGTVTTGNTGGDTSVAVNIGTVAGGGTIVTVAYQVTINNPVPVGVTEVKNQGIVTVDNPNIPDTITDDPDDPTPDDPTETPINAQPIIDAFKKSVLLVDADSSGGVSPGDTLQYQVTIINSGNQNAPDVVYTDTPDSNTALVNGSVATTLGTVTTGNGGGDNQVVINIGTLAGQGGQALVTYNVTIDNPLPAGVTQVVNQGIVTDSDPRTPDEPTDDPNDPDPDDPTETPVTASPKIDAYKRDTLLVDADNNGSPSPGDSLLYNITIINSGNQAATALVYDDNPDPNTTLVVGSVASNVGTITEGNTAGDTGVGVQIGTLSGGGAEVNISYQVTINSPVPAGVTQVSNQGIVTSDDPKVPDTLTDDPDDPTEDDPTDTPIVATPIIESYKRDTLFIDADANGSASPGDTLLYNITIVNSGNQAAPGVLYTDQLDPNVAIVPGSVNTDRGAITDGNDAGDTTIIIDVGTLPGGGASANISYRVTIDNPLPAGVTQVSNQGIVTDEDPRTPDEPTDDPDDPDPDDPTDTPITASPKIESYKRDTLLVDADNNGFASPGDTLLYNITIINSGNQAATDLAYSDNLDPNTTLVVGSVASSVGTITVGNTAGDDSVAVAIGTLAGGGTEVNISYHATINNPLPAGVTQVSNQGIVTSADPNVPDEPTDDPDDPDPDDPTDTPILAEPKVQAYKRDTLFIDADGNGSPSPGDTLLYNITIVNSGNQAATGLDYTDILDPNVAIVPGSVNTDSGAITDGNDAGDTTIIIDIGTLPGGGASANISYRVTINTPLPANVTQVSNQGIVSSDDPKVPDVPTDDPDDPDEGDPTDTPIVASPKLQAYKRDVLLVDADDDGVPSPGDTLLYNITILNSGNQAASGLVYNDNPDPHTTLVVGSVASDVGTITQGNTAADTGITVDIGTLPGGDSLVNISYHATINNPLPADVVQVSNQGIVSSDDPDLPDTPTDDPDDPEIDDPTDTVIVAAPLIDVYKQASLLVDADSNGSPSPGDTLLYNITIFNNGNQAATAVVYDDTPDANTALVVGSVATALGSVTQGNDAGDTSIQVTVGTIAGGNSVAISYRVTINNPLPPSVVQVSNQGTTSGSNFPDVPSDDPSTPGLPKDPTDVVVVAAPVLSAHKLDSLLIDADGNGAASPGDTLLYNVTVINSGNTAATGVVYNDTPDANTQLVPGSVRTNLGTVTTGNGAGDTTVSVNVGEIPAGSQLEISYQVQIDEELPEDVTELRNQGIVHNDNDIMPCPEEGRSSDTQGSEAVHCPEIPTNDPSTTAAGDPTITLIDPDPTAEEPTDQPGEPRSIFLPQINHKLNE